MTSHGRVWMKRLARPVAWQSKSHKVWFMVCAALLSFYFSYVLFLSQSAIFTGTWETAYALVWFVVYAAMIFAALCLMCGVLIQAKPSRHGFGTKKASISLPFFALSASLSLFVVGISFLAVYPGAVTYDNYNQWMQVQTGQYNSWHPVFHTLLLWLGNQLTGSYSGVVVLQLIAFSLALAYLMATLRAWGLSKAILFLLQALVITSPLVDAVLMSPGKDNAMTMGAVLLCAQSVNAYLSKGQWFRRPLNGIAFGLTLAFTTLVRHNGFFYTVPLLLCIFLAYPPQRKRTGIAAGVMAAALGLVMGPLYGSLDLVRPNNMLEESVGIPMTILCDTRAQNPELLDGETASFLETLLPDGGFAEKYVLHNYNSVKFEWPREYIAYEPPEKLLRMTLQTIQRNPQGAFQTLNAVTDLVWDVTGNNEGMDSAKNSGELAAYPPQNGRANQLGKRLQTAFSLPREIAPLRWLTQNIGVSLALLLVCGLLALYRSGPQALLLCVPVLLYDLGTALLLCGNDARFFQFSPAICLVSALVLWQRPGEPSAAQP